MWKFANSTNINTLFTIISTLLGFESLTQGWGAVFTIACFTLAILLIIKLIQGRLKTRHSRSPSEPPNSFFPPYLCYLPNRNQQTIKLRDAIKAHEDYSIKQRPLVCLIPGEYQESHYGFKACFVGETLPKLYCGIKDTHDVHCIELTLCDCSADHLELQDDIFNQLMEKLPHYPPEYTKAGVSQLLAEQGKPVIVSLDISIEDCQPVKDIIEKGLIEFWRDWPAPQAHDAPQ